ncbi:MAG: DUF1572 family protein [Planctomycetota bacterium]|jgi:uncharacterized damage-inducible protein DinB
MNSLARRFCEESVRHLREEYMPRLEEAVGKLPDDDLWWSPHGQSTSVGTLLRHLEGNVRQWILSGLGGLPDHRHRAAEFEGGSTATKADLMTSLGQCVSQACAIVSSLDDSALAEIHRIQEFETTGLGAIYHVVEHFSWHTGQIVWISKLRAGERHGIAFYDDEALNDARNA